MNWNNTQQSNEYFECSGKDDIISRDNKHSTQIRVAASHALCIIICPLEFYKATQAVESSHSSRE